MRWCVLYDKRIRRSRAKSTRERGRINAKVIEGTHDVLVLKYIYSYKEQSYIRIIGVKRL